MYCPVKAPGVRFLSDIQQTGEPKGIDIANSTDVSKSTVSRWSSGEKSLRPRTQLFL